MKRNNENREKTFKSYFRLLKYVKPFRFTVLFLAIMTVSDCALGLLGPKILQELIDVYIPEKRVSGLINLSILFLVLGLLSGIITRIKTKKVFSIAKTINSKIRQDIFNTLQDLPLSFFDSMKEGQIFQTIIHQVGPMGNLAIESILSFTIYAINLVVIIIFMFWQNIFLSLVSFGGVPILIFLVWYISKTIVDYSIKQQDDNRRLYGFLNECLTGIRTIKTFSQEHNGVKKLKKINASVKDSTIKMNLFFNGLFPATDVLTIVNIVALYLFGCYALQRNLHGITVGILVAFAGYIYIFWSPISNIIQTYMQITQNSVLINKVLAILDEEKEHYDDGVEMKEILGNIEYKNVSFSYISNEKVLEKISFTVNNKESCAIVGPTGGGKSTIINLLFRFYEGIEGNIFIDGIDINTVEKKSLRKQIGIMVQEPIIFSGTIMENIRYGSEGKSDIEVLSVAQAVGADRFISKLPEGYNTVLGAGGDVLSTGQKQLISIIRILLQNPRILILDEATSEIDCDTEVLIQKAINYMLKGRTSLIVAHRLSTIKSVDKIIYVSDGKIMEQGRPQELFEKKGLYYNLYQCQYLEKTKDSQIIV